MYLVNVALSQHRREWVRYFVTTVNNDISDRKNASFTVNRLKSGGFFYRDVTYFLVRHYRNSRANLIEELYVTCDNEVYLSRFASINSF